MATKYTYIYCRISADRQGRSEGVKAQEKWGRAYALDLWPDVPVKIFSDNDLSAAKDNVMRPAYERMREGIRQGECAHLWAVEQSRLTRLESEWFRLAADLISSGVSEVHTRRGGIIDVQGVVGGIMAVLGAHEVRELRKRLNDKLGELAAEGRPIGHSGFAYVHIERTPEQQHALDAWHEARDAARQRGQDIRAWREAHPRPSGGAPVLDAMGRQAVRIDPERAEMVRWAADKVLSGWTLTSIVREFRARGMRGAYGGKMTTAALRQILISPAVAGFRTYRGEIVGKATWEPVLDEPTWRAVRGRLTSPDRGKRRPARRYLLTRYAVCGSCMCAMHGAYSARRGKSWYRCNASEVDGNCGRMHMQVPVADEYVTGELFRHIAEQQGTAPGDEYAEDRIRITTALEAIEQQRREWMAARDAGQLNLSEYLAAKSKFDSAQAELECDLADLPEPITKVDIEHITEAWPEMTLDEKRKLIGDWIDAIVISPRIRKPVMADVAVKAGVTVAAVFRYCHGDEQLPEDEAGRIAAAAEEIGFVHRPAGTPPSDDGRIKIMWRR